MLYSIIYGCLLQTITFLFTSVKDGPLGDMIVSSNPEILDIDADYKEPQSCSVYASEIYNHLRVAEVCAIDIFLL